MRIFRSPAAIDRFYTATTRPYRNTRPDPAATLRRHAVVPFEPDVLREQRPLWVHPRTVQQASLHAVPPQTSHPARNKQTVVHNVPRSVMVADGLEEIKLEGNFIV